MKTFKIILHKTVKDVRKTHKTFCNKSFTALLINLLSGLLFFDSKSNIKRLYNKLKKQKSLRQIMTVNKIDNSLLKFSFWQVSVFKKKSELYELKHCISMSNKNRRLLTSYISNSFTMGTSYSCILTCKSPLVSK